MILALAAAVVPAAAYSQQTPEVQVFDLDVARQDQAPVGCLDDLIAGQPVSQTCVAVAEGTCEIDGTRGCRASMTLAIDAPNPQSAPLGSTCYALELTADVTPRRRAERKLEEVGNWCFTQTGNTIHATGSCFTETIGGKTVQAFGTLQGVIYDDDGTTHIRAIHNESVP